MALCDSVLLNGFTSTLFSSTLGCTLWPAESPPSQKSTWTPHSQVPATVHVTSLEIQWIQDDESGTPSPLIALPCESKLVQCSVAFFFRLGHVQAKAPTAFESCWEFVDRTGKIVLVHGGVLLLRDGFSLEEENEEGIPPPCENIFGKICSTKGKIKETNPESDRNWGPLFPSYNTVSF